MITRLSTTFLAGMKLVSGPSMWNRAHISIFKPVLAITGRQVSLQARLYRYSAFLPEPSDTRYDPLAPFVHFDPGMRALEQERQGRDPLGYLAGAQVRSLTPAIGDEINAVDLTRLDSDSKDQLALHVARRGVLVFRNQEQFINKDKDWYRNWGSYFGRIYILPVGAHPKDLPEMHLSYRSSEQNQNLVPHNRISSHSWHSDASFELQPPGLTTFFLFSQLSTGSDTIFSSGVTALKRLSPQFVAFLRSLKALHSGVALAEVTRSGKRPGVVRREPVENEHPVVRRHPVTDDETLFVDEQMTARIMGLKVEESDAVLNFLYNHIAKGVDFQARVQWRPNTVVIWDNRVTNHTAIIDTDEPRHGGRITAQAERPIPALDTPVVPSSKLIT